MILIQTSGIKGPIILNLQELNEHYFFPSFYYKNCSDFLIFFLSEFTINSLFKFIELNRIIGSEKLII